MHRLFVSLVGLATCTIFALSSPQPALGAGFERFECGECEEGGGEFCSGECEQNDHHYCGARAWYCTEGWQIECVCTPEDYECPGEGELCYAQ